MRVKEFFTNFVSFKRDIDLVSFFNSINYKKYAYLVLFSKYYEVLGILQIYEQYIIKHFNNFPLFFFSYLLD